MGKLLLLVAAALAYLGSPVAAEELKAAKLIFEDDFHTLNLDVWKHELTMGGGGNGEFEMYVNSRQNSYILEDKLVLRPSLTADSIELGIGEEGLNTATLDLWGQTPPDICTTNKNDGCLRQGSERQLLNPIRSAKLTSKSFSLRYGRVEVVAKVPKGDWIWPAIWLLPEDNQYGVWPCSGEIDMMESMGNDVPQGLDTVFSTLHWGPSPAFNQFMLTRKSISLQDKKNFHDEFHTFGLYWDEKGLFTYIDSEANKLLDLDFTQESFFQRALAAGHKLPYNPWTLSGSAAPFNQKFYLIFNVAVGGTSGYFSDEMPGKPWRDNQTNPMKSFWEGKKQWVPTWGNLSSHTDTQNALVIDSVKVWSVPSTEATLPAERSLFSLSATQNAVPIIDSYGQTILLVVLGLCVFNLLAVGGLALYAKAKLQGKPRKTEMENPLMDAAATELSA